MLIGCGLLSYQSFYPFLATLFLVSRSYCVYNINQNETDYNWDNHPFFFGFLMFLAESCTGFIDLYNKISFRRKSKTIDYSFSLQELVLERVEYEEKKKITTLKLLGVVLIIAFLDLAFFSLNLILSSTEGYSTLLTLEMKGLQLIYLIILSYFCLHVKLYRHQAFAIAITLIGLIPVVIKETIQIEIPIKEMLYLIIIYFFISCRDILEKWLMVSKFINPVRLLFFEGLFGTLVLGIFLSFSPFLNCSKGASIFCENAKESFKQMVGSWSIAIGFLFYFICCLFYNLFYILTKYWFSPTLMVVSDCMSLFLWMIIVMSFSLGPSVGEYWWLVLIGQIFVLAGCIIYNEIIICYFCQFECNTKKEINKRCFIESGNNANDSVFNYHRSYYIKFNNELILTKIELNNID